MDWPEANVELERLRSLKTVDFLNPDVRELYRDCLGKLNNLAQRQPDSGLRLLEEICARAQEDARDLPVCLALAEGLSKARHPGTIPLLASMLGDPRARAIREDLAELLGSLGDPGAGPALVQALSDSEVWVRAKAARALGLLRCVAATGALIQALTDEDGGVRANAARALGQIGASEAAPTLAVLAESDDDEVVRKAASAALEDIQGRPGG